MTCDFCYTNGHDVLDCQNIDPEQLAIEIAARDRLADAPADSDNAHASGREETL